MSMRTYMHRRHPRVARRGSQQHASPEERSDDGRAESSFSVMSNSSWQDLRSIWHVVGQGQGCEWAKPMHRCIQCRSLCLNARVRGLSGLSCHAKQHLDTHSQSRGHSCAPHIPPISSHACPCGCRHSRGRVQNCAGFSKQTAFLS